MTRDEMVDRMSSAELSVWWALMEVEHDDQQIAQWRAQSKDGEVIVSGRDEDDDDGPTE